MSSAMRKFAVTSVNGMLDHVLYHLAHAVQSHDEEPVHKLRVSVRRLQQSLRLFRQYVNAREARRIRKQLRKVLHGAAEVRNRDVTVRLLRTMRASPQTIASIERERRDCMQDLQSVLKNIYRRAGKWRNRLELE